MDNPKGRPLRLSGQALEHPGAGPDRSDGGIPTSPPLPAGITRDQAYPFLGGSHEGPTGETQDSRHRDNGPGPTGRVAAATMAASLQGMGAKHWLVPCPVLIYCTRLILRATAPRFGSSAILNGHRRPHYWPGIRDGRWMAPTPTPSTKQHGAPRLTAVFGNRSSCARDYPPPDFLHRQLRAGHMPSNTLRRQTSETLPPLDSVSFLPLVPARSQIGSMPSGPEGGTVPPPWAVHPPEGEDSLE